MDFQSKTFLKVKRFLVFLSIFAVLTIGKTAMAQLTNFSLGQIGATAMSSIPASNVSRIDPNRTFYYIEKNSQGNWVKEAVYSDSAGNYIGHQWQGTQNGQTSIFSNNLTLEYISQAPPHPGPNGRPRETLTASIEGMGSETENASRIIVEQFGGPNGPWLVVQEESLISASKSASDNSITINSKEYTYNFDSQGRLLTKVAGGEREFKVKGDYPAWLENAAIFGNAFVEGALDPIAAFTGESEDKGTCIFDAAVPGSGVALAGSSFWNCIEQVLYSLLSIVAWVLGLIVWIFSFVINITVLGMKEFVDKVGAIGSVWKVFRDFTNILFIFILLYLAISTILGLNEHGVKHTLSKLIIVAILINFSMFFSKVVIDSANILAITFYKKINPVDHPLQTGVDLQGVARLGAIVPGGVGLAMSYNRNPQNIDLQASVKNDGIAGAFMGSFRLQKIFEKPGAKTTSAEAFAARPDAGTVFIMGIIVMFIVICIFLAAILIFIKRLTALIKLMMISSLAFASLLLEKTEKWAHQWWEELLKEAFYAPIFMAIIWMAILVMTDPNFGGTYLSKENEMLGFFNVSTIVNYVIVINFFVMALVVGEQLGASGASAAMKSYKWLKTNTGGRALQAAFRSQVGARAYSWLEGKKMPDGSHAPHKFVVWATKAMSGQERIFGIKGTGKLAEVVGHVTRNALRGLTDAKIGAGESFRENFTDIQHAIGEHEYEIKDNLKAVGDYYTELAIDGDKSLDVRVAYEKTWEAKDDKNRADILAAMGDRAKELRDSGKEEEAKKVEWAMGKLVNRLSPAQKESTEKAGEGSLAFHRQKYDEFLKGKTDRYGDVIKGEEGLERLEEELRSGTLTTAQEATTKSRIRELEVGLRQYVRKLNPSQQNGLSTTQKSNARVFAVLDSKAITSMEGSLDEAKKDEIGESVLDVRTKRLLARQEAQKENTLDARRNLLKEVVEWKHYIGEIDDQGLKDMNELMAKADTDAAAAAKMHNEAILAMAYYDENLTGQDGSTTQAGRNNARTYKTQYGANGEVYKKKFDEDMLKQMKPVTANVAAEQRAYEQAREDEKKKRRT